MTYEASGRILGGHIIGAEASTLIHEIVSTMAGNVKVSDIGNLLHSYPTLSEGISYACQNVCAKGTDSIMNDLPELPWIDISVPLKDGMVHWPGDPPVKINRVKNIAAGDLVNLSMISMSAHSGTHVDAPIHFIPRGKGIDEASIETLVGRARVIEIRDTELIKPDELTQQNIQPGERILFKTINSSRVWQSDVFVEDFVFISDDAAHFLVERKVRAIGIDYLSVGSSDGGSEVHKVLLAGGVWIIEGLDLLKVTAGEYELICLPLKLVGGDGAPARAIIRPYRSGQD
ncbi:cyclase family protein [Chloroflexota bacterium]